MDVYFIRIYYALKIDCTYIHFQLDVLQLFNYLYFWTTMGKLSATNAEIDSFCYN